jgi:hypothetical protein
MEGGLQLGEGFERDPWARSFVGGKERLRDFQISGSVSGRGSGPSRCDRDWDQLFGKTAGGLRRQSFLVAGESEGVLVGAGDMVAAGDPLGGQAHGEQRGRIVLGKPGVGAGFEAAHGQQAHGFNPSGHDHAVAARADAQVGLDNGFQTGGAEAVDGDAGNLDRQLRAQSGKAGDVPGLFALRLRTAQDHVVDFRPIQLWNPLQGAVDCKRGEIVGACGREGAFGGAADRGANGADEDGFRHGMLLDLRASFSCGVNIPSGANTTVVLASEYPDPGLKAPIFGPFSGG